jgi:peptidoglycan/xylan/chitin deacetylase (PgdA/CDA1 family)
MIRAGFVLWAVMTMQEAKPGVPEKMKWPDHKKSAIVLTYDDGLPSHRHIVVPQLDEKGFKGTFFLYGQTVTREEIPEWRQISRAGHELGNHSLYHPCSGRNEKTLPGTSLDDYSVATMLREIAVMNQFLYSIDGDTVRTYAYPCGQTETGDGDYSVSPGLSGLIRFARNGGEDPVITDFDRLDAFHVPAFAVMTGDSAARIIDFCESVLENNGLGIILFHGVGGDYLTVSEEAHQELINYLDGHASDIWVATFKDVMNYLSEHNH